MTNPSKSVIIIDNYDSFVYNLQHYFAEIFDGKVEVIRNDKITIDEIIKKNPVAIVLSPGPCSPDEAGICLEVVEKLSGKIPILGVCLGHQSIGQAFGGKVIRAPMPMHGKISIINHAKHPLFQNIPNQFNATRYHSLIIEEKSLPKDLESIAKSEGDNLIMAVAHKKFKVYGVQFHPESICSEYGKVIIRNFLKIAIDG